MANAIEVKVPDIGDFKDIPVIEILVSEGDEVSAEDPLVSLESDKATMDVPSPGAGKVLELAVSVGDKVSEGSLLLTLETADASDAGDAREEQAEAASPSGDDEKPAGRDEQSSARPAAGERVGKTAAADPREPAGLSAEMARNREGRGSPTSALAERGEGQKALSHATPTVRRFARELGVDLAKVTGTGRKGRILSDDVTRYVKEALSSTAAAPAASGIGMPEMPAVDFSKFGPVETRALSRIKKLTGTNLRRAWLVVPHVTQHDEADITELEAFRKSQAEDAKQRGVRLTMLAFLIKASVAALKQYPTFNASLDPAGENLIIKNYWHIGIAVDTSEGLVVPVIRDADRKSLYELAAEMGEISERARSRKLKPDDMQGASFTISSLGGIGGTFFTPIVNAPEVAILGVSRSSMKPVWDGKQFQPRLMLPLSLSYDHRVRDGAAGAHFCAHLGRTLSDIRRLLL
ncbi:MAG: dihydrolipoyllysine-residue acetyltransferase [Burkholderiales bacterium]|nr:dihydrolipoyllysine-residue acetyltransferase [Burkholderiales bacterium]